MLLDINNPTKTYTYKYAIENPIPSPRSLWMPATLIKIKNPCKHTKFDIACKIANIFLKEEISKKRVNKIVNDVFTFDAPVIELDKQKKLYVCELTHGPTKAFKDFGARFSAAITKELCTDGTIGAATSGDTGGAIVSAANDSNLGSLVFFPNKKISNYQRKQITNSEYKNNIPIALEGTFDDCQYVIKKILGSAPKLYSGNSVNILRIIAQIIYYFWIGIELNGYYNVSIPSGNLGNAVAALIAVNMGAPIDTIIIAGNENLSLDLMNKTGNARETLSSAMDVLFPSNYTRLEYLDPLWKLNNKLKIVKVTDDETREKIQELYFTKHYLIDPHTSVGFKSLDKVQINNCFPNVVLSTAAPIKFKEVISDALCKPSENFNHVSITELNELLPDDNDVINEDYIKMRKTVAKKIISKPHIILSGMPGAGKTTVGNLLASRLQLNFIDVDTLIEQKYNMPLHEILNKYGTFKFTEIERDACLEAINSSETSVISPGGSANLIKEVFNASSEKCIVIWLNVKIEELLLRLGNLQTRGIVFKKNETFQDLYTERCKSYNSNYDIQIFNGNYTVILEFLKIWYN
jgi:threonine synthase